MTVIPVPGMGFQLARLWPDGEHDSIPVIAFVVQPDESNSIVPDVITPTGDSLARDDYIGAVVMPDGRVFHGYQEFENLERFVTCVGQARPQATVARAKQ